MLLYADIHADNILIIHMNKSQKRGEWSLSNIEEDASPSIPHQDLGQL